MPPVLHLDPAKLDMTKVVADRAAIHAVNPQRFEMEQLTAIVYVDPAQHVVAGYKDVAPTSSGFAATCRAIRFCPAS